MYYAPAFGRVLSQCQDVRYYRTVRIRWSKTSLEELGFPGLEATARLQVLITCIAMVASWSIGRN